MLICKFASKDVFAIKGLAYQNVFRSMQSFIFLRINVDTSDVVSSLETLNVNCSQAIPVVFVRFLHWHLTSRQKLLSWRMYLCVYPETPPLDFSHLTFTLMHTSVRIPHNEGLSWCFHHNTNTQGCLPAEHHQHSSHLLHCKPFQGNYFRLQ